MKKMPSEVSRGKMADDLKQKLSEIFNKINILKRDIKTDKSKIKEYCDCLFENIIEVTQKAHNYLEKHRIEFMEQIDLYEMESQSQFEVDDQLKGDFDTFVKEIYIFHDKWIDYLKKFIIDEVKLAEAISEAKERLRKFEKEILRLKERAFKGNLLTFEKNPNKLDSSIIGSLTLEKREYLNKNFENLTKVSISIPNYEIGKPFGIESLRNCILAVCCQSSDSNLVLCLLNRKGEIVKNITIILDFTIFYDLKIAKSQKALFIYTSFYGSYFNGKKTSTNYYHLIKSYDLENLTFIKEVNIGQSITWLATFNDQIFCLTNQLFKFNKIFVYDVNLDYVETIGQQNTLDPYYFTIYIKKIEVTTDFFFLLENNRIMIMNRSDGVVFKSFDYKYDDFKIFFTYVIGYDYLTRELSYYDLDGYVVYKTKVNLSEQVKLLTDGFEDILFFDPKSLSFWY